MKSTTVTVACRDGQRNVAGYVRDDVPGLAITPRQSDGDKPATGRNKTYRITHVASGRALPFLAPDLERAEKALVELGQCGIDWGRTAESLVVDTVVRVAFKRLGDMLIMDVAGPKQGDMVNHHGEARTV